jgi:O-antigen biosynthesis protein
MDFKKPRIAIWYYVAAQTNFRNDGACLFMNYNLRKLLDGKDAQKDPDIMAGNTGNVVRVQPNITMETNGSFDLNLLIDHGEDGINAPLDFEVPHPNAYWIADSHLGYPYRLRRAKEFDFVFASHSPSIEKLVKDGIPREKIHYLPWAAEHTCYRPYPVLEKWNWCFIGHINNEFRLELLDRFCREFPVGIEGYMGWRAAYMPGWNVLDDCAKKFSQSRIILNESVQDDLNMRTFEGLACRKLVLTEDVPDLHKHFKDGEHLVTFKTIDEAVEKAHGLLADDERRTRIAKAGYEEFLAHHTYQERAKEILKICLNYTPEESLAAAL